MSDEHRVVRAQPPDLKLCVLATRLEFHVERHVYVMPDDVTLASLGLLFGRSPLRDPSQPSN